VLSQVLAIFAAAFSVESILKLLHDFDCADLAKFCKKTYALA
jgi:hypothetical protein